MNGGPLPEGIVLRRHDAEGRYELLVDGHLAAYAEANRDRDVVVMPHTFTVPAFRGNGYAAQVVRFALEDILRDGGRVLPTCWFVAEFIEAHPEFQRLLVAG